MEHSTNQSLIDALSHCAAACNFCVSACLDEQVVTMLTDCIKIDMDCAAICTLTASFVARNSAHARHLLPECVEICNKCATECEKHSHMEHCKVCAEACRQCAAACEQMEMA